MHKLFFFVFMLVAALLWSPDAVAQVPRAISFQGVLADAIGTPLPDGPHQIRIGIYYGASGGTALYTEQQNVTTSAGVFSMLIGTVTPLPTSLAFDRPYYLGISVDGAAEMAPRTMLTSVPYALYAARAIAADRAAVADSIAPGAGGVVGSVNGLDGDVLIQGAGGTTVTKNGGTIVITSSGGSVSGIAGVQNMDGSMSIADANGPVATIGVADNGIGQVKLQNDAVSTEKIQDGAVGNSKLRDNAVTTSKMFDNAVTESKLDNDAVSTPKLQDNAVSSGKIQAGAVTLDKIGTAGAQQGQVPMFKAGALAWSDLPVGGGSGLTLPYTDTIDAAWPAIFIHNFGGDGITAQAKGGRNGIRGMVSYGPGGSFYLDAGVAGYAEKGRGLGGTSKDGSGVEASSENGNAAKFSVSNPQNASSAVHAITMGSGQAVYAYRNNTSGETPAIEGISNSPAAYAAGVKGRTIATSNNGSFGVYGINEGSDADGAGVHGRHQGGGRGVWGHSDNGVGVYGSSEEEAGVVGVSTHGPGVRGVANTSSAGVVGESATSRPALQGTNSNGIAIEGMGNYAGIRGIGVAGAGIEGISTNGPGVSGIANSNAPGVRGSSSSSQAGVRGENAGSGPGVMASSGSGAGLWAFSSDGAGVHAYSGTDNIIEAYGAGGLAGNLRFRVLQDGNVRCDGAFTGGGADLAEAFAFEGAREEYEPGDVLVISADSDRKIMKSVAPNATSVAGVYATKPGVLLAPYGAEAELDHLIPMGVVGVIPTKVCGESGPIRRGDLLVTSSVPGHAMKAVPVMVGGVAVYPTGAVIGKALENFDGGERGVIEVLVNVK